MNETLIFFKIRDMLKIIDFEAIFTKAEINNVVILKLYLPRQKSIIYETFVFSKIQDVLKKHRYWSCIYLDSNKQWMKQLFSSKYEMYSKHVEIEALFTKSDRINEWIFVFLQNNPLEFNISLPARFPLVRAPLKLFFLYALKVYRRIYFDIHHIQKSYPWMEFSV